MKVGKGGGVHYLLFLTIVCGYFGGAGYAAPMQDCASVCGSSELCETGCFDSQSPPMETTCGEYDGGASNGWCDGDTCVSLCDSNAYCNWECYWGGNPSSCGEYGECTLICGDGVCSLGIDENPDSCDDDCGSCGDGQCSAYWGENDVTDSRYCAVDCGPTVPYDPCEVCDPTDQEGCSSNEVCNAAQCCKGISTICASSGVCTNNSQCCSNEVCIKPGPYWTTGYCGSKEGAIGGSSS